MSDDKLADIIARQRAHREEVQRAEKNAFDLKQRNEEEWRRAGEKWKTARQYIVAEVAALNEQVASIGLTLEFVRNEGEDADKLLPRYSLGVEGTARPSVPRLTFNATRLGVVQIGAYVGDDRKKTSLINLDDTTAETWRGLIIDFLDAAVPKAG